jgi:hypothetical protein
MAARQNRCDYLNIAGCMGRAGARMSLTTRCDSLLSILDERHLIFCH